MRRTGSNIDQAELPLLTSQPGIQARGSGIQTRARGFRQVCSLHPMMIRYRTQMVARVSATECKMPLLYSVQNRSSPVAHCCQWNPRLESLSLPTTSHTTEEKSGVRATTAVRAPLSERPICAASGHQPGGARHAYHRFGAANMLLGSTPGSSNAASALSSEP